MSLRRMRRLQRHMHEHMKNMFLDQFLNESVKIIWGTKKLTILLIIKFRSNFSG